MLEMFRQHNIKARIEYRLADDYTIISMVENGLGISILAELILKRTQYNILNTFVIGGSLGLAADLLRRADQKLSFGKMAYPHLLMRLFLVDQVYRAFKIIRGNLIISDGNGVEKSLSFQLTIVLTS